MRLTSLAGAVCAAWAAALSLTAACYRSPAPGALPPGRNPEPPCSSISPTRLGHPVAWYVDPKNDKARAALVGELSAVKFNGEAGHASLGPHRGRKGDTVTVLIEPVVGGRCLKQADAARGGPMIVAALRNYSKDEETDTLALPSRRTAGTQENWTYWVAEGDRSYFLTPSGDRKTVLYDAGSRWSWGVCHHTGMPGDSRAIFAPDTACDDEAGGKGPATPPGLAPPGERDGSAPPHGPSDAAVPLPARARRLVTKGGWLSCADGCCYTQRL